MKKTFAIIIIIAVTGFASYWWFLGPRTHVVEGVTGPANSINIKAYVLTELPLTDELPSAGLNGRVFRMRYWDIKPGGVVPLHSHRGRPATIYVVNGEILEFANGSVTPKRHKGGEISVESEGLVHHWRNDTDETVHLVASDIYANINAKSLDPVPRVRDLTAHDAAGEGVEAETLAEVALAGENIGARSGVLRTRRVTLAPGSAAALNVGGATPALVYVLEGVVEEDRTDQPASTLLAVGANSTVRVGVDAQWTNPGDDNAVLIISDIDGTDTE